MCERIRKLIDSTKPKLASSHKKKKESNKLGKIVLLLIVSKRLT